MSELHGTGSRGEALTWVGEYKRCSGCENGKDAEKNVHSHGGREKSVLTVEYRKRKSNFILL